MTRSRRMMNRIDRFVDFVEGVRACAAAGEANRRPSREALIAIGLDPASADEFSRR